MVQMKGGDKWQSVLDRIAGRVGPGISVDVGFMGSATYPDGTSVVLVAALNEYGTATQPPRPFFRNAIDENSSQWPDDLGKILKAVGYDAPRAMALMGKRVQEQIQGSINKLREPPLAESTVERKGFDKPLIEHSTMIRAVTYKVNTGDE